MQQYYHHRHSLFVEFSEFSVLKLHKLTVAVRSNIIGLNAILKLVINICVGVDLAIIMFVSNNLIKQRLVPDFVCQSHTLIVRWVFSGILLTNTYLLVRRIKFLAENIPVCSLVVNWDEWKIRYLRYLEFWSVELGPVLQRLFDKIVIIYVVGSSQYSGGPLFSSFWMDCQNSLLDRYRHDFVFSHDFQNHSCLFSSSLKILLRQNRLFLPMIILFLINFRELE